tara:strand:+ start:992 stop:1192 length:201 start_codon:yes stop_codon:yes gene_type:complete
MINMKDFTRKRNHISYISKFLRTIDTECTIIRLNMNDENQEESVKKMRIYTLLQKKYKKRLSLITF